MEQSAEELEDLEVIEEIEVLELDGEHGAAEVLDFDVLEVTVGHGGGVKVGQTVPPVHLGSRLVGI